MDDKKAYGTIVLALAAACLLMGGLPARQAGAADIAAPAAAAAMSGQASAPGAVQALIHPRPAGPIAERVAWARGEAKAYRWEKGFWIGFGIRRLMGEHSSMGWYPWGGPEMHLTLEDLISGSRKTALEKKIDNDQAARGTASSMPGLVRSFAAGRREDEPERPVMKDIGILLRMTAGDEKFPADIRISNLDLPFDLEERPFVWLGPATAAESLDYLIPLYGQAAKEDDKRSLLWAIGMNQDAAAVVPFVERILAGKESEEIRAEAASCLGEQNDPKALALLLKTIKTDPSEEVREQAVGGLVEMALPAASEALTALALSGTDRDIRKEAVRGLADKADAAAVKALEKIAAGDKDAEIQEEAIHALADLPGRGGLAYLVNLVKTHPDTDVRREAVEAIGDVGGDEAVKILTEWARGRRR
jgi:hypothetical protein